MPADRKITVNVEAEGTRNSMGEYIPGPTTAHTVWASKYDVSLVDVLETGGARQEVQRRWRIRYSGVIYETPTARLEVVDGGVTFSVVSMAEVTRQREASDLRRRWIELTGAYTA